MAPNNRKIIDCHVHVFPDEIAEKAIIHLTNGFQIQPAFDGTVDGLFASMDSAGIETVWNLPVATKPAQVESINNWSIKHRNERMVCFGAMHPDYPSPVDEIKRLRDLGFPGIKFQPNWQNFRPDDPRMFPIYQAMEGSMIVYFHSGGELKQPHELFATPKAVAAVHELFPNLTICVAHFGGFDMWDDVEEYLMGENVYLDLSCCFPQFISDERLLRMMRAHGMSKVLFGSDSPCGHPAEHLARILSLPLTDEEKDAICSKNALKLLFLES